jgi:hypothetical protein
MENQSKFIFSIVFFCMTLQIFGQNEKKEGSISLNTGVSYGLDIEEVGVMGGIGYLISNDLRLEIEFKKWFIPKSRVDYYSNIGIVSELVMTVYELNWGVHYFFLNKNSIKAYGIASIGGHYVNEKIFVPGIMDGDSNETHYKMGLGFGAGLEYSVGLISVFTEPKYFLTGFDQFNIPIGIRVYIK